MDRRGRRGSQEARSRRERAQATSQPRSASDPETPSLARRAGSGSNSGGGRASGRGEMKAARVGPDGRLRITLGPMATTTAPPLRSLAISRSRRGTAEHGRSFGVAEIGEMRRLRFEDIRELRLPVAAWRSEKRGIRLLRAYAGQEPVVLRRPLPDGLSAAKCAREAGSRRTTNAPRAREVPWRPF